MLLWYLKLKSETTLNRQVLCMWKLGAAFGGTTVQFSWKQFNDKVLF